MSQRRIEKLRKEGLGRAALTALEGKAEEKRLRREIAESVRRCASADRQENLALRPASVTRHAARR